MGKPASSTKRDERPSYEQQWARILEGSFAASSIIVRSLEACRAGILPRTLVNVRLTSSVFPETPGLVLTGRSNLKGYGTVLTMDFDIVTSFKEVEFVVSTEDL